MAISPPTDIVLDVVRAADPTAVDAARDRLGAFAAGKAAPRFDVPEGPGIPMARPQSSDGKDAFARFESMVLQTFLQSMLPQEAESVFGGGLSGDMWKSMMAEQLSNAMTERGGIGIADRILRDYYVRDEQTVSLKGVSRDPGKAEADRQDMLSTAMVQEIQRRMAQSLSEDALGKSTKAPNG